MASPTPDTDPHPTTGINSTPTFAGVFVADAEIAATFAAAPQAANPNTTGATLAALETEVNEVKQALRNVGMISP